ncbi:MAG: inositol monophosphatase family protein [Vicinamibacterales bacterium]
MATSAFLETARDIVLRAGEIQSGRQRSGFRIDKKGVTDLVTEVDLECERMCRAVLAERYPDHDILAEELGGRTTGAHASKYRWIFDPLDGTTNYAHGLPIYCSSLGLEVDGEVVVAAIYDPSRQELFTAEKGEGAWLNGERLRVSATDRLIDSLLVTGFPYDVRLRQEELIAIFAAFLTEARAVRRLGSAAVDLCYVAAGRFDGFWEQHLKPWDVAAGSLIVTEAGGRMSRMDGTAFSVEAGSLLASNGCLHGGMVRLIAAVQTPPGPFV